MDMELVELQFQREGAGWVLRLIIDKKNGVSVDDCAAISRETGRLLEVEELIDHPYHLEVSSPGLDRPLRQEKDFLRFQGRMAKIKMKEPIDNQYVFVGKIDKVDAGSVILETDKALIQLPMNSIKKARLVVEF